MEHIDEIDVHVRVSLFNSWMHTHIDMKWERVQVFCAERCRVASVFMGANG